MKKIVIINADISDLTSHQQQHYEEFCESFNDILNPNRVEWLELVYETSDKDKFIKNLLDGKYNNLASQKDIAANERILSLENEDMIDRFFEKGEKKTSLKDHIKSASQKSIKFVQDNILKNEHKKNHDMTEL